MKKAKFWLIVGADPESKHGTGKKYTSFDEAYAAAIQRVEDKPYENRDGVMLCCPAFHVRPKTVPQVEVERLRDGQISTYKGAINPDYSKCVKCGIRKKWEKGNGHCYTCFQDIFKKCGQYPVDCQYPVDF